MEIQELEVAAHQFQATVGGEVLLDKLNGKISLDDERDQHAAPHP